MVWVNDSFGTRVGSWCSDSKLGVVCWDRTHNLRPLRCRVTLRLHSLRFSINPYCFHLGVGFVTKESVNLANLGLLEFRLVRELGAGQSN